MLNHERLLRANRVPYAVEVELKYDVECLVVPHSQ